MIFKIGQKNFGLAMSFAYIIDRLEFQKEIFSVNMQPIMLRAFRGDDRDLTAAIALINFGAKIAFDLLPGFFGQNLGRGNNRADRRKSYGMVL